ncbi:DNA-binding protein [Micromonospora sp. NBC_01813]|uniref:DNA-binding protein n=1 Tax=Micromonospora sp. NBC_01813 TaxID=2975988 RepID=UPI003084A493|nr:helix-turn-helix domain-containing protein [Micromonospora sp. NBC_01813]
MPASVWTVERIRALGAVTDVATVGEIFGLSRNNAYELARGNRLPVPVLRVGSRYRVSVAAILTALGVPADLPPRRPRLDHAAETSGDHHPTDTR